MPTKSCSFCGTLFDDPRRGLSGIFCGDGCRWASKRRQAVTADTARTGKQHSAMDLRIGYIPAEPTTVMDDWYRKAQALDPCTYCGGVGGHSDHIVPRACGGGNEVENRTGTCRPCNSQKSSMSLLLFMLRQRLLESIGERTLSQLRLLRGEGRSSGQGVRRFEPPRGRVGSHRRHANV